MPDRKGDKKVDKESDYNIKGSVGKRTTPESVNVRVGRRQTVIAEGLPVDPRSGAELRIRRLL